MGRKLLVTILGTDIAPRFDLCTEVLVATEGADGDFVERKTVVLPRPSSEDLCRMILSENITDLLCGGIEEEYHQFLTWKDLRVIDFVSGTWTQALDAFRHGRLKPGDNLRERKGRMRDDR